MKKSIELAALAIAVVASTPVLAQVSNFTGPSAGVSLDHVAVTSEVRDPVFGIDLKGVGQSSVGASVYGAYGFNLSNNMVLSVGASYSLTNAKAFDLADAGISGDAKLKNQTSVYLEPGFLVSDKTLAYGKVSYEAAKFAAEPTGQTGESKNIHGVGYGFGIRTMIDKAWSLQAEIKHVKYGSADLDATTSLKTTANIGSIGLGYKF